MSKQSRFKRNIERQFAIIIEMATIIDISQKENRPISEDEKSLLANHIKNLSEEMGNNGVDTFEDLA